MPDLHRPMGQRYRALLACSKFHFHNTFSMEMSFLRNMLPTGVKRFF
jgi:hypothetical protein